MNKKEIWKVFEGGDFMSLTLKERRAVVREVARRRIELSKIYMK